jgi:uncharacterized lipoprotein YmbA
MKSKVLCLVSCVAALWLAGCASTGTNQIQGTVLTPPVEYVK